MVEELQEQDPRRAEPSFLLEDREMLEAWLLRFHRATLCRSARDWKTSCARRDPLPRRKMAVSGIDVGDHTGLNRSFSVQGKGCGRSLTVR